MHVKEEIPPGYELYIPKSIRGFPSYLLCPLCKSRLERKKGGSGFKRYTCNNPSCSVIEVRLKRIPGRGVYRQIIIESNLPLEKLKNVKDGLMFKRFYNT